MSINSGKHLALFLPSLRGGGAERVMLTLAEQFTAKGHKVDLVMAKAEGPYIDEISNNVNIVDFNVSRVAHAILPLINYLHNEKPTALLSTINNANIISVIAKLISRSPVKIVLRESNTLVLNMGIHKNYKDKLMLLLTRLLYPFADAIIAVSKGVAEDLKKEFGFSDKKIHVIYNPVIEKNLYDKANEKQEHPWYQDSQVPVVIAVGRLTKQKGFDILIEAIKIVNKKKSVRLLILGEGKERKKLEKLIEENGLQNTISIHGFVSNPFPYIKNAAVFVLSSRTEGLPNSLIQAMALGTTVVATDCRNGPKEILESGKWGNLGSN